MKLYTKRLGAAALVDIPEEDIPELALPFDVRQKGRFRATLENGEDIGVDLPRTDVLSHGTVIGDEFGHYLKIVAAPQAVTKITARPDASQAAFQLMRGAYHLGNRHVPLMVTPNALYMEPDHVLQDMVCGLGLQVEALEHPFEPEIGAYGHSHHGTHE